MFLTTRLRGSNRKMPEISIIIPAHNEAKQISKTLNSIRNSYFKDYEIIVVCDSCFDATNKVVKRYTKKSFNVSFKNVSKTRNYGTKKAKGKILVFLDADTTVSKNYLKSIKDAVDRGATYGTAKWISESNSLFGRYWAWGNNMANKRDKTVSGNFFVIKKAFNGVKGFDVKMKKGEDTDMGDRLREKWENYIFIEHAYYIPSERKYKTNKIKFWVCAIYESWLYKLNKAHYKKKFSHS